MTAFGMKRLAELSGVDLATVYRWKARIESGTGVSDPKKRALIKATAASEHAIVWADFYLAEAAA